MKIETQQSWTKRQNAAAPRRRRKFIFLATAALTHGELGLYSNLSESGWVSLIYDTRNKRHWLGWCPTQNTLARSKDAALLTSTDRAEIEAQCRAWWP